MPLDRLTTRADWRCRPAIASARISCAAESCCALPMQPGERWSCLDRCRWMRCSWDDPPDVNCRAKSYSAADHLINPSMSAMACSRYLRLDAIVRVSQRGIAALINRTLDPLVFIPLIAALPVLIT